MKRFAFFRAAGNFLRIPQYLSFSDREKTNVSLSGAGFYDTIGRTGAAAAVK